MCNRSCHNEEQEKKDEKNILSDKCWKLPKLDEKHCIHKKLDESNRNTLRSTHRHTASE